MDVHSTFVVSVAVVIAGDGSDDHDGDMEQRARVPQQPQHTVCVHDAVDVFPVQDVVQCVLL